MKQRFKKLINFRSAVRVAVVGFIAWVGFRHRLFGETLAPVSPEAYCPFGGFETLYNYLIAGRTIGHAHHSNLVIFLAALVVSLLFRSAFCGWICPFGTIQDWFYRVGRRFLPRAPHRWYKTLRRADSVARYLKYAILAAIVWGTIAYGRMVFRDYDPYAGLLNLGEAFITAATVSLILVLTLSLFISRPWCRYLCPLGALLGLAGLLSPFRIVRTRACVACGRCQGRCPMGIDLMADAQVTARDCNSCLSCLDACQIEDGIIIGLRTGIKEEPLNATN